MPELDLDDVATREARESGSGVILLGGTLFNTEDYNPDLQGQKATARWEEMRRADPEIASGLARMVWPLVAAEWKFDPADDTDEEREIAEFCDRWIFGTGRLDPFAMRKQDFLRHALMMVAEGFAAFEKVWGTDEDGRQVYAQLAPIAAKTVSEFKFSRDGQGRLEYMRQRVWTARDGYRQVDIPADKLALFVFGREGDNLFGWPILRQVYKPWYFKDKLLRIDAIRHERHGVGFTVIKVPKGAKREIRERAEKVGREARVHERQYVVIEEGQSFDILYPRGVGTDIIASVKYLDAQISQVLFSEFMHLGASESGSRAVSKSKIDFMLAALQGVASLVSDTVNSQLVVPLVGRNWGRREKWPRLVCEDLSKMGGPELVEMLAKLLNVNVSGITAGPEIEKHLRGVLQLPPMPEWLEKALEEAQRAKAERAANPPEPLPAMVPPPGGNGNEPGQAKADANGGAGPAERKAGRAARFTFMGAEAVAIGSPVALSREPYPHERYCAFAEMKAYLQNEPKRVWVAVVAPYRRKAIDVIARSAATASDAELAAGRIKVPFQVRLAADLRAPFLKVYMRGRRSVAEELARQRRGAAVSEPVRFQEEYDGEDVIEPTAAQRDWIAKLALAFAATMLGSLKTEAIRAAMSARQADLSATDQAAAVVDDLLALSEPVQVSQLSGQLTRAFTTGRNEQAEAVRTEWDRAYYSAIMDDTTCEACALLDGEEHDPGDPAYQTPNPNCAGAPGANCRCETIYVVETRDMGIAASERVLYDPDQPRVPMGDPAGGQWGAGGGGGSSGDDGGGGAKAGASGGHTIGKSKLLVIGGEKELASAKRLKAKLESSGIPDSHLEGIPQVTVIGRENIGKLVKIEDEAMAGFYDPRSGVIAVASSNPQVLYHEIGHHVQYTKLSDSAASEWRAISAAETERLSAYAGTSVKEHFAETYSHYVVNRRSEVGLGMMRKKAPKAIDYMERLFTGDLR